MQAINLLISDSPQLFFVVGMDREKVAAGLAVKYEKILPYLSPPEGKGNSPDAKDKSAETNGFNSASGLEFGYTFIEKFIQIPFRIPRPAESGLTRLLNNISPMMGDIAPTTLIPKVGSTPSNEMDSGLAQGEQTLTAKAQERPEVRWHNVTSFR